MERLVIPLAPPCIDMTTNCIKYRYVGANNIALYGYSETYFKYYRQLRTNELLCRLDGGAFLTSDNLRIYLATNLVSALALEKNND